MPADSDSFDVFISYSTKDRLIAESLVERLRLDGIRCWIAPGSIGSRHYPEAIASDIPRCRVMLVLLSDKANYSHHVEREVTCALEEDKPFVPVRIEPVEPSIKLRYALTGAQRIDAFPPFLQHLDTISGSLRARLEHIRREAPAVRVIEPAGDVTTRKSGPLTVEFEVLLGNERRLKRVRLELRRDGALVQHRALTEPEINDRGGLHRVEWILPAALAGGGHYHLAVLACDTDGQEGSAQMQGSFMVQAAPAPVEAPVPIAAETVAPAPLIITEPAASAAVETQAGPDKTPAAPDKALPVTDKTPAAPGKTPVVAEKQPARASAASRRAARAAEVSIDVVRTLGGWCFRMAWMLVVACALGNALHGLAEPYTATRETGTTFDTTFDLSNIPDSRLFQGLPGHTNSHSPAQSILQPNPSGTATIPSATTPPAGDTLTSPPYHSPFLSSLKSDPARLPATGPAASPRVLSSEEIQRVLQHDSKATVPAPASPPFGSLVHSPLLSTLEQQIKEPGLNGNTGLSRVNPDFDSLFKTRPIPGKRIPGRPLKALWETVKSPRDWNKHFHAADPPDGDEKKGKSSFTTAALYGGAFGAVLGVVAGLVVGGLALVGALLQRLPLAMLPAGGDTLMEEFSATAAIAAIAIFDLGARQPDTGEWSTSLFWWVGIVAALCFLGSSTLRDAANRRRQIKMLGTA